MPQVILSEAAQSSSFRRFNGAKNVKIAKLLRSTSVDLLQQISIMGPVIQQILADMAQEATEQRMVELIHELASARLSAAKQPLKLVTAILQAESEAPHNLVPGARPQNRFL